MAMYDDQVIPILRTLKILKISKVIIILLPITLKISAMCVLQLMAAFSKQSACSISKYVK